MVNNNNILTNIEMIQPLTSLYGVDLSKHTLTKDSYTHILIYSYTHILIYSYTHTLIHSYTHILIYSYTHIFINSYTHRLTY